MVQNCMSLKTRFKNVQIESRICKNTYKQFDLYKVDKNLSKKTKIQDLQQENGQKDHKGPLKIIRALFRKITIYYGTSQWNPTNGGLLKSTDPEKLVILQQKFD